MPPTTPLAPTNSSAAFPQPALRSSAWPSYSPEQLENHRILVVDQIGVLFGLYGGAQAAFVGGAFAQGLHNIIEPLSWGLPVAFGPNLGRHWEAQDALRDQVAQKVTNLDEALSWLDDIEHRAPNQTWAQSQQGTLSTLAELVDQKLATSN